MYCLHFVHTSQSATHFLSPKTFIWKVFISESFLFVCLCVKFVSVFTPNGLSLMFNPPRWKAKFSFRKPSAERFSFSKGYLEENGESQPRRGWQQQITLQEGRKGIEKEREKEREREIEKEREVKRDKLDFPESFLSSMCAGESNVRKRSH